MRLLLDTHILLWAAMGSEKLPAIAKSLILDTRNSLHFSAASIWEIAIKLSLGREDFKVQPHIFHRSLLDNDYQEVSVTSIHAAGTANLEMHHKDPFDRILIAQAIAEEMLLLTVDDAFARYPGPIRLLK